MGGVVCHLGILVFGGCRGLAPYASSLWFSGDDVWFDAAFGAAHCSNHTLGPKAALAFPRVAFFAGPYEIVSGEKAIISSAMSRKEGRACCKTARTPSGTR